MTVKSTDMLSWLATTLVLAVTSPDSSHAYFPGLDRPHTPSVYIERDSGPVILIVVDALRPDHLDAYGYDRKTAPHLARLADDGIVLTNYFVNANWTRPSMASLLTGLPPAVHGVESDKDRLVPELETLPEVLQRAGIKTGAVIGNGNAGSAFGFAQGFDEFADTTRHWKGLPTADEVVDLAIPFVRAHRDERFFLLLFLIDPHDPYRAPEEYEKLFVRDPKVPLVRSPHWEIGRYGAPAVERMKDTYDAAIRYTDAALGRFVDTLAKEGLYGRSTLVVTADHGEAFGEHGIFLHSHHLYDEIVRAPLIVRAPRMSSRGGYSHFLFQSTDLLPTIARHMGAKTPRGAQGVDVFAQLARPRLVDRRRIVVSEFSNFGITRRMARTYREKVVHAPPANLAEFSATVGKPALLPSVDFERERFTYFDLERDPRELVDLSAAAESSAPRFRRLEQVLRQHEAHRRSRDPKLLVERLDRDTLEDLRALGYIQ